MKSNPTVRAVSATEAKNKFGEIIKHAYASGEHLIVEKSGIPVVAIIPMADYQQLVGPQATVPEIGQKADAERKRTQAARRLKEVMDRVHAQMPDVPEEEGERLIQQAVDEIRAERAKQMLAESRAKYSTCRRARRKK